MRYIALYAIAGLLMSTDISLAQQYKDPVDFVNPLIGTVSHLLTTTDAAVYLPHALARIAPVTVSGLNDKYLAQKIYGFPIADAVLMPSTGKVPARMEEIAADCDNDLQHFTPYFYSGTLPDYDISVEYTVGRFSELYRFVFPGDSASRISLFQKGEAKFEVVSDKVIKGCTFGERGAKQYFYLEFSLPFTEIVNTGNTNKLNPGAVLEGKDIGITMGFATGKETWVYTKAGLSFISTEQASKNLTNEIPAWDFDSLKQKARDTWNAELSKLSIKGGTENQHIVFYTALYHALWTMTDITEDGKYFSIFDKRVHESGTHDFYTRDGLWDSYRVKHPLQLIMNSKQQEDMLESYASMYKQFGTLPLFPFPDGELTYMLGNHAAAFTADTWFKGYRNFDMPTIYEGLRKNALERTMLPDVNGPANEIDTFYQKHGWFPALKKGEKETHAAVHPFYRRQAVSITLEFAYDDWCLAQLAKELGKKKDNALFMKRARNYSLLFNKNIGFMAPKDSSGQWIPDFDPMLSGGQGGRDYFTECNSWVYTFNVQHDVAGLINQFGGRKPFVAKLDSLFLVQFPAFKFEFQSLFPDMTGLIGMYPQGNEPAFHIPYLYDYAGEPWKTQKLVRQSMDAWFTNSPTGLCGDDDDGTLSSWFVFSSMGFYPFCPGMPIYLIGSPLFEETSIKLDNGKVFTILARNVSDKNKYIQSARLNGKYFDRTWFSHDELMRGGMLEFIMGSKPNKGWGTAVNMAPPSMTLEMIK
jgi:predicted alpha-1,2-mannosidase